MNFKPSKLVWICMALVIVLNVFMFFHDPLKFSNSKKCIYLTCRKYSLIFALVILGLDLCHGVGLTFINPLPYTPTFWFIPFTILAVMIILLNFNESTIVVKDNNFNPLPELFFTKTVRIIFRSVIALLYLILFIMRYATEAVPTLGVQPKLERFFFNRFGGLTPGNQLLFFLSWLTIFTLPLAGFRLYQEITYHPTKYNQPLGWNR